MDNREAYLQAASEDRKVRSEAAAWLAHAKNESIKKYGYANEQTLKEFGYNAAEWNAKVKAADRKKIWATAQLTHNNEPIPSDDEIPVLPLEPGTPSIEQPATPSPSETPQKEEQSKEPEEPPEEKPKTTEQPETRTDKTPTTVQQPAKSTSTPPSNTSRSPKQSTNFTGYRVASEYVRTYTSYSGHDMVCIFEIPLPNGSTITKVAGEVQTISYSIHNEKMPVRVLGDMNMKSIVFGNRTVAGSLILTVFDQHWAASMMKEYLQAMKSSAHVLTDELPPMNVSISMCNEYGDRSRLGLYGVTFVNEGQTMSVQDMYTENTYQFYAKDVDYLTTDVNTNSGQANHKSNADTVSKKVDELNKEDIGPVDNPKPKDKTIEPDKTVDPASPQGEAVPQEEIESEMAAGKYRLTEQDLAQGREKCLAVLNDRLNERLKALSQARANGEITGPQYRTKRFATIAAMGQARKEADEHFASKMEENKPEISDKEVEH